MAVFPTSHLVVAEVVADRSLLPEEGAAEANSGHLGEVVAVTHLQAEVVTTSLPEGAEGYRKDQKGAEAVEEIRQLLVAAAVASAHQPVGAEAEAKMGIRMEVEVEVNY